MLYDYNNDMMTERAKTHYTELLREADTERLLSQTRHARGAWWRRLKRTLSLLLA